MNKFNRIGLRILVGLIATIGVTGCNQDPAAGTGAVAAKNTNEATEVAKTAPQDATKAAIEDQPNAFSTAANALEGAKGEINQMKADIAGATPPLKALAASTLAVSPKEVDLGMIPTGDTGIGTVRITNTGKEAITVTRFKASCGCTTGNLPPNVKLQPGESRDVEVRLKAGTSSAPLTKTGTFEVEGQQPVQITVKGFAKAFVEATPQVVDARTGDKGTITFRSTDGTPFRVTSMRPDVLTEFSAEKSTEFTVELPFETWRSAGAPRNLQFFIDHPKAPSMQVQVRGTPEDLKVAQDNANPMRATEEAPDRSSTVRSRGDEPISAASDFARLIKSGRGADILEQVARGSLPVGAADRNGSSLLAIASEEGALDLVHGLIDLGADLEAADRTGKTALMNAAKGQHIEIIRTLLDAGADVNARDRMSGTALSWACGFSSAPLIQELIDAGADVNTPQDLTGFTPLTWAAGFGDPNIVPILIKHGANINAEDLLEGAAPIIHAARTGKADSIRELVKAGADVNFRDRNGKTPLLAAASGAGGTLEKIQLLIELGADVQAMDNRGMNALDFARQRTDMLAESVTRYFEEKLGNDARTAAGNKPATAPAGGG